MHINGIDVSGLMRIKRINRRLAPTIENLVFDVPGRHGMYHIRNQLKQRRIDIDFDIIGTSTADRIEKAHALAGILASQNDLTIILPDEPQKMYIGSLSGDTDLEEIMHLARGTISFICSDPYALDVSTQSASFGTSSLLTVSNTGTAETYPVFEITFNAPTTFFEIRNHSSIYPATGTPRAIMLGSAASDFEQTPVDPMTLLIHDTMGSTSGWQAGVSVDGGIITGQMASDGQRFYASDFGSGSEWHGPALRRVLSTPVQDFLLQARIKLNNLVGQSGRVEIYLFDVNDRAVGKIALKDNSSRAQLNTFEARAGELTGGTYFVAEKGDTPGVWNNFDGILELERNGNRWRAYIAKVRPDGTHYARRTRFFTDTQGLYAAQVSSVQVHIAVGANYEPCDMSIDELRFYRINQVQQTTQVPYIAYQGDVIQVDCGLNRVLLNGRPSNHIVALENHFFALEKGQNLLELFPKGITSNVQVTWRRRWV